MKKLISFLILTFTFSTATEFSECIHLLNRTSLGVTSNELNSCLKDNNYKISISNILKSTNKDTIKFQQKPDFAKKIIRPYKKMKYLNIGERKAFRKNLNKQKMKMKKWWVNKLMTTQTPFLEKMVLFWHSHFTSSLIKVRQPALMYQQNQLFRKYAFGNFGDLLHAIIEDPAMLIYLDNRGNRKKHPNENFARELLELFTLGEGNYSEKDIKALAKALTGYSLDKNMNFRFKKKIHDKSKKRFLEYYGNYNAHQLIDIILEQEATSIFIVTKLWKTFIGYNPNSIEIKRLAKIFRNNNYELKPLMQAMLNSKFFKDSSTKGIMIKSPIEFTVGTLRSFEYQDFDSRVILQYSRRLGQNLLDPPNVKGWVGGKNWINANTLLIRKQFINRLTRGDSMKHLKLNLFDVNSTIQSRSEKAADTLLPVSVFITPANNFNKTLKTILQHPLYQLK
ncbi:MAG: hypothetical protein DRG78_02065 [Epsilonproteobacteria bacterium]|nr:MAG: hypothetical protein DRG78_02065 [Campylobacterota bacterium]